MADEEALVKVGPRVLVNRGRALHALVHRQIPDVVLVDLEPHLVFERHRVELARGLERVVDDVLGHAVTGHVEEADALAGVPDCRRNGGKSVPLVVEGRPEVDHRNRTRRFLDAPHR